MERMSPDSRLVPPPSLFAHWSWKQQSWRGGHRHKLLQSTGKYDPHFLVQVLLFAGHVRGVSKYSPYMDIFRRVFRCFPASVQMVSEQILDGAVVPSASIMSRARLYVDAVGCCACECFSGSSSPRKAWLSECSIHHLKATVTY